MSPDAERRRDPHPGAAQDDPHLEAVAQQDTTNGYFVGATIHLTEIKQRVDAARCLLGAGILGDLESPVVAWGVAALMEKVDLHLRAVIA